MESFEQLLAKTGKVLEHLHAPYMVTGGAAVRQWSNAGALDDIDIILDLPGNQAVALINLLHGEFGEEMYIQETMLRDAQAHRRTVSLVLPQKENMTIDFLVRTGDKNEEHMIARAVVKPVLGQNISFIAPEDLILTKAVRYKKTGLQKHWDDARAVFSAQGENLDRKYLLALAEVEGITDLLKAIEQKSRAGS